MPGKKRRDRKTVRPICPVHGRQMLVRCVVDLLQYRYCPEPDCCESVRTVRAKRPRRRKRREVASPAAVEKQVQEKANEQHAQAKD